MMVSQPSQVRPAVSDLFSTYQLGLAYDEMFEPSGLPRTHCHGLVQELMATSAPELVQYQSEADRAFLTQGITFTVYGDDQGTERIFPYDLLPRIITGGGMADHRAGAEAAPDRHQPLSEGRLPRRADSGRRHRATRSGPELPPLPPRDARRERPPRHLRLDRRHRSHPPAGWPLRRPRRQPARAERRVLHAGESRGDEARPAGPLRSLRRQSHRALRAGAARDAACARPEPAGSDHRGADAGRRQLGLLRARVPGPRDGRRPGRRARPARARRHRLHADDVGPAPRRRDLPPRRRRLSRSAGVPRRFHGWVWPVS